MNTDIEYPEHPPSRYTSTASQLHRYLYNFPPLTLCSAVTIVSWPRSMESITTFLLRDGCMHFMWGHEDIQSRSQTPIMDWSLGIRLGGIVVGFHECVMLLADPACLPAPNVLLPLSAWCGGIPLPPLCPSGPDSSSQTTGSLLPMETRHHTLPTPQQDARE